MKLMTGTAAELDGCIDLRLPPMLENRMLLLLLLIYQLKPRILPATGYLHQDGPASAVALATWAPEGPVSSA